MRRRSGVVERPVLLENHRSEDVNGSDAGNVSKDDTIGTLRRVSRSDERRISASEMGGRRVSASEIPTRKLTSLEIAVGRRFSTSKSKSPSGRRISTSTSPTARRRISATEIPTGRRISASEMPSGRRISASEMPTGRRISATEMPTGRRISASRSPCGRRISASEIRATSPTSSGGRRLDGRRRSGKCLIECTLSCFSYSNMLHLYFDNVPK